jgi:hypothetical protein
MRAFLRATVIVCPSERARASARACVHVAKRSIRTPRNLLGAPHPNGSPHAAAHLRAPVLASECGPAARGSAPGAARSHPPHQHGGARHPGRDPGACALECRPAPARQAQRRRIKAGPTTHLASAGDRGQAARPDSGRAQVQDRGGWRGGAGTPPERRPGVGTAPRRASPASAHASRSLSVPQFVQPGGNAAKAGLKSGDTVLYTSSFFGDELWCAHSADALFRHKL